MHTWTVTRGCLSDPGGTKQFGTPIVPQSGVDTCAAGGFVSRETRSGCADALRRQGARRVSRETLIERRSRQRFAWNAHGSAHAVWCGSRRLTAFRQRHVSHSEHVFASLLRPPMCVSRETLHASLCGESGVGIGRLKRGTCGSHRVPSSLSPNCGGVFHVKLRALHTVGVWGEYQRPTHVPFASSDAAARRAGPTALWPYVRRETLLVSTICVARALSGRMALPGMQGVFDGPPQVRFRAAPV